VVEKPADKPVIAKPTDIAAKPDSARAADKPAQTEKSESVKPAAEHNRDNPPAA
jgi:hypothetical protein